MASFTVAALAATCAQLAAPSASAFNFQAALTVDVLQGRSTVIDVSVLVERALATSGTDCGGQYGDLLDFSYGVDAIPDGNGFHLLTAADGQASVTTLDAGGDRVGVPVLDGSLVFTVGTATPETFGLTFQCNVDAFDIDIDLLLVTSLPGDDGDEGEGGDPEVTPTPTPEPTQTTDPEPSPTTEPTPDPTSTESADPEPTPTPAPTSSPTTDPEPTAAPSASTTPTPTPPPTSSPSTTPAQAPSPTPTQTPTPTRTPSPGAAKNDVPTSRPVVRKGATGEVVATMQHLLRVSADGIFGSRTLAAVKVLQRRYGLVPDGIVGPSTWATLLAIGTDEDRPWLRQGDRGTTVSRAQHLLGVAHDGLFGSLTARAVRAFQQAHDLRVDGIIGKTTWDAMLGD